VHQIKSKTENKGKLGSASTGSAVFKHRVHNRKRDSTVPVHVPVTEEIVLSLRIKITQMYEKPYKVGGGGPERGSPQVSRESRTQQPAP
jgi:hypothetical protein